MIEDEGVQEAFDEPAFTGMKEFETVKAVSNHHNID